MTGGGDAVVEEDSGGGLLGEARIGAIRGTERRLARERGLTRRIGVTGGARGTGRESARGSRAATTGRDPAPRSLPAGRWVWGGIELCERVCVVGLIPDAEYLPLLMISVMLLWCVAAVCAWV